MLEDSLKRRPPALADALSKWQIFGEVGRGGFAVVYRARRRRCKDTVDVALRIVPLRRVLIGPTVWTCDDLSARLNWVLTLHRTHDCSRILQFRGFEITDGYLLSWSDLCTGGDLFDRVTSSPEGHLEERDAQLTIKSLLEAVIYTHGIGNTIHRDIKPENVLYKRRDSDASELVLMDYGCALPGTSRDKVYFSQAGSPGYMSPEMCAGTGYTMNTDEYSLGVTCYEILTGRSPVIGDGPEDLVRMTVEQPTPFPSRYWRCHSRLARDFVEKLMIKDPQQRMTVEEAIHHPWLEYKPVRNAVSRLTRRHGSAYSSSQSAASSYLSYFSGFESTAGLSSESSVVDDDDMPHLTQSITCDRAMRKTQTPPKDNESAPAVVEAAQRQLAETIKSVTGVLGSLDDNAGPVS